MRASLPLVVFSHLRWNFVYQRPQHLLARLGSRRRVLFIEEPVFTPDATPSWEIERPESNVQVCRLRTPLADPGFAEPQLELLHEQLPPFLKAAGVPECIAWFYTPMALPLRHLVNPRAVVFDCMDELSAFRHAPPRLLEREAELLGIADVVFTGGPSLFKAKKDRNHNVHCFPSSVDAQHFGKARHGSEEAADQAGLPHPRFGFFGVIDERFDTALLDAVARARPDWQFVMVGPVVKIDPADLPRHANIHYLGQRSYAELPGYLAGWDVCLLPFARNESTRFISPTKTLEYMAAEKPIVSTPITDVAEPYGDIVYLGDTPEMFLAACERALNREDHDGRVEKMRAVLARTSWDAAARAIEDLLEQAVERRGKQASAVPSTLRKGERHPVIVAGAGPTGLSAAYHLGDGALLLEQNDGVGGWCRSIQENGFTFDFAGHIMFSNDEYVHKMYKMLLGDNVHWQNREAWIYSKEVYTRYPFQGALYGLPPQVIKECIVGAIEARHGALKPSSNGALKPSTNGNGVHLNGTHKNGSNGAACNGNGHAGHNGNGKAKPITDCCADGVLESTARLAAVSGVNGSSSAPHTGEPRNFEEFIYKVWGSGIAKHFAIPYNRKLWAVPLTEMETSWLGGRVPMPDLEEMIDGALQPVPAPMGPNARFGYPLRGGFQALMDGFLPHVQDQLRLNTRITALSPRRHTITVDGTTELSYEHLISTMPLPVLVRLAGDEVPEEIKTAVKALRYVSVRCVHLGIGREQLTDKHWIYYPEDSVFHRIFVQGNASPHCNPPGGFGLTCEITYSPHKPLPCDGDDLIQRCIQDCHKVGFFKPEDPVWTAIQCDMPHAYVVYDHARLKNVSLIRAWLAEQDILLAGRYSEWEYYNSDHAFLAGKKAAEKVRKLQQERATPALV